MVVYYSGWLEPFQVGFATTVANDGAVPLVQMNPTRTSVAAIAAGQYDSYLSTYAEAVRAYHHPVILSFGHEMNGYWYSWGYTHTSPAVFVAAWRHIVTLFRALGAQNVTWLWTINTIHKQTRVPSPGPWWPGNSYVNWVGIDGYFTNSSSVFASVFGPTIVYVRTLTHDPILITETSATPVASQPAKIADLFAGIRLYGLLGFVWFDSVRQSGLASQQPCSHRRVPPGRRDVPQGCIMNDRLLHELSGIECLRAAQRAEPVERRVRYIRDPAIRAALASRSPPRLAARLEIQAIHHSATSIP